MKKILVLLAVVSVALPAMADVSFTPLGTPATGVWSWSDAYGVTNDGMVVGSMYGPSIGYRAFSWTSTTGLTNIGSLGHDTGSQDYARAVTPDGAYIIGESQSPCSSFRYVSSTGTMENLSYPQTGAYDASALQDISDDGKSAAGLLSRYDDGCYHAALWQEDDGWRDLGVLFAGDYESTASAISGDGKIVAGNSCGNRFAAFVWTSKDGMTELENPWGQYSAAAIAMSEDGSVITGQANDPSGDSKAIAWYDDGSSLVLDCLDGGVYAAGYGISGDGKLVAGTAEGATPGLRAVFWDENGDIYDLETYLNDNGIDTQGFSFNAITEVSQNGMYLTGRGTNAEGNMEAFLIQIPEPASLMLLALGGLFIRRR